MANLAYLQLVRCCNQRCRFCSNPPTDEVLDLAAARAALDDFVRRGYDGVILTGGEPSLSPIAAEVVVEARRRGLGVRMITNGSLLAEPARVAALVAAGLEHFHLSLHTLRAPLAEELSRTPGSLGRALAALENLGRAGVAVDVNTVIIRPNAGHLDETVRALVARFPFVRHFVWNNLDPTSGHAAESGDAVRRLAELELSLARAMRFLAASGRTFRVERVPLCYMADFPEASTETRKIVKGEERIVHFLDEKGVVRQTDFHHNKAAACARCPVDAICAGLFDGYAHQADELHPLFVDPERVRARVLAEE